MQIGGISNGTEAWGMLMRPVGNGASTGSAASASATDSVQSATAPTQCQTCKSRRYQDVSNDPSVSFQTPTKISSGSEYMAVRGHEQEHVSHEQIKAKQEGRRVVSQTVTIHTSICPECGRPYVSGGTTKTVTSAESPQQSSDSQNSKAVGQLVDRRV